MTSTLVRQDLIEAVKSKNVEYVLFNIDKNVDIKNLQEAINSFNNSNIKSIVYLTTTNKVSDDQSLIRTNDVNELFGVIEESVNSIKVSDEKQVKETSGLMNRIKKFSIQNTDPVFDKLKNKK